MGFTDLERELYSTEYMRWKTSYWGAIQCQRVKKKGQPVIPYQYRVQRAIAIAKGEDPNKIFKCPEIDFEKEYEQLFINEINKRKEATKQ